MPLPSTVQLLHEFLVLPAQEDATRAATDSKLAALVGQLAAAQASRVLA